MYKKRSFGARGNTLINKKKHHRVSHNGRMNEDKKPVTANDICLSDFNELFYRCICDMLKKRVTAWTG